MVVTGLKGRLAAAQPSDIVFLAYVSFTGLLILLFGWRLSPGLWIGLTLTHVALLGASLWFAGQRLRYPSFAGFVRDTYPILVIFFLYWELRYLALLFNNGYYDALVLGWEEALFGEQLAVMLSERFPQFWLSELMHFFYATYWFLLPLALAWLYWRGRIEGYRELVYVALVVFFGCYVVFAFFPVQGPHYEFPVIGGRLAEGPAYRFVHWILADGGSKGAAFPSSHVAVPLAILVVAWRYDRVLGAALTPFVVGLTIGTVYGRFHYGVDTLAGLAAGAVLYAVALHLRRCVERAGAGAGVTAVSPAGNSPGGLPV